jgi:4-amino-4-deoxy-L-arabinose transferase-like glycosyltransferase
LLWSGFLLAVAVALRFHRLGQDSLWVDEYASLVTAKLPLAMIPAGALSGDAFEPPLYFWLLHLAIGLLGDSEAALRLLSAVTGAVTVPLVVLLIRALGQSAGVAILGGGLLALSPLHLWYSQEARPYALFLCLGLGSLVCLLRALRTDAVLPWIGFAGLAALAVLTHVVALVFPLVGWMWAIRARRGGSVLRPLFAATLAIVLVTAPFAYRLAHAVSHAQGTGSPPRQLTGLEIPYTMFTYVLGYSFGPSVREIQDEGASASLLHHPAQSSLGAVAVLALIALVLRLRSNAAKSLGLLALAPMAATWLGSVLSGKAYNVRYALPGVIGFLGLVALGISGLREPRRWIAAALLAGLFLWADAQWFIATRYWKEDSRSAVAWLQATLPPGATVAVAPGYQTEVLTYYARRGGANLVFASLPDTISSLPSPLPDALLITRLHHLPHWRELVRGLELGAGRAPQEAELVGYRAVLFRH